MCLEHCNISYLDLSEAPALADIRASSQGSSTYTVNWGSTGANIWHICVRDNPQIKSTFPLSQFPLLRDLYNWNDNQSGILESHTKSLKTVLSANNHYSVANFSGCFPENRGCELNLYDNNLKSLDISDDPGLLYLNVSLNSLNQTAVDEVLQTLDSYNTTGGSLDLTGNVAPSLTGLEHANNLTTRNWEVKTPSQNNPPIANFTSNVTSGTMPLSIQFTDASTGNPTSWSWDFGDGTFSTEKSPDHVYTSPGNYVVTLVVRNSNSADFKDLVITVLKKENSDNNNTNTGNNESHSDRDYNSENSNSHNSGGSSSSGGSGGTGGSPEPQSNVEAKELSQAFIMSGKTVKFDFPRNATCIAYISLDSKKTAGKTTTIVEMLKGKSTLVSALPSDEVYRYVNIWVGNGGFATSKNIENAVVSFKVEKAWIKDKKIDQSSVTLNNYLEKKWVQLPATLSGEDDTYLYFTAKTSEFSCFAITGKIIETAIQPSNGNKTEALAVNETSTNMHGNMSENLEQTNEKGQSSDISGKENVKTSGFETVYCIISLLVLFLCKRSKKVN